MKSTAINNPFNYSALTKLVSYGQRTKVNMNVLNQEARNPGKNFHPVLLQRRRHGVDWGGRVHPTFLKNRFCDSPKFDEKMVGGGGTDTLPREAREIIVQAAFLFFLIEEISISTMWLGVNSPNPSRK